MIRLAELIETFLPDLECKYANRLLPSHRQALTAIGRCRTQASGTAAIHCHDCDSHEVFPLSCGHRFCPQCQHEAGEVWLRRIRAQWPYHVWINPVEARGWDYSRSTALIREIFEGRMVPMTLDGLAKGVRELR